MRIVALAVAAFLFALPAAAQTKGKLGTAPGQTPSGTPGQTQKDQNLAPGSAKDFAPGRPGGMEPPGQSQRDALNPQKKTK